MQLTKRKYWTLLDRAIIGALLFLVLLLLGVQVAKAEPGGHSVCPTEEAPQ